MSAWNEVSRKRTCFAKGISQDEFSENGVSRRSKKSFLMRTMTVSGSSPTHSPRRVVPSFYRHFGSVFFENNKFCFESDIFSHKWPRRV